MTGGQPRHWTRDRRGLVRKGEGVEALPGSHDIGAGGRAAKRTGAVPVRPDVSCPDGIPLAAVEAGPVDMLANNAGALGAGGVLDGPGGFADCMNAMLRGPFLPMHHLVRTWSRNAMAALSTSFRDGARSRAAWQGRARAGPPRRRPTR